jgi:hypothetical protein
MVNEDEPDAGVPVSFGGLLSLNTTENPDFVGFNHAFLWYCSSDCFLGAEFYACTDACGDCGKTVGAGARMLWCWVALSWHGGRYRAEQHSVAHVPLS